MIRSPAGAGASTFLLLTRQFLRSNCSDFPGSDSAGTFRRAALISSVTSQPPSRHQAALFAAFRDLLRARRCRQPWRSHRPCSFKRTVGKAKEAAQADLDSGANVIYSATDRLRAGSLRRPKAPARPRSHRHQGNRNHHRDHGADPAQERVEGRCRSAQASRADPPHAPKDTGAVCPCRNSFLDPFKVLVRPLRSPVQVCENRGGRGHVRTQAILSPAGHWILPGGLFAPVLTRIKRAVGSEAADGFDRSLPSGVVRPVAPRSHRGAHRYSDQFGRALSHHSGELFLVGFLLRCHARGAQVRRCAGS